MISDVVVYIVIFVATKSDVPFLLISGLSKNSLYEKFDAYFWGFSIDLIIIKIIFIKL